jgi:hypothetical protein
MNLVDRIQAQLETFSKAAPQGKPDLRALAVTIVREFRDFIGDELKRPDAYDTEQPSKGQGWE